MYHDLEAVVFFTLQILNFLHFFFDIFHSSNLPEPSSEKSYKKILHKKFFSKISRKLLEIVIMNIYVIV